jgi:hypothetical protein
MICRFVASSTPSTSWLCLVPFVWLSLRVATMVSTVKGSLHAADIGGKSTDFPLVYLLLLSFLSLVLRPSRFGYTTGLVQLGSRYSHVVRSSFNSCTPPSFSMSISYPTDEHVPPSLRFFHLFLACHIVSPEVLTMPMINSGVEPGLLKLVIAGSKSMHQICTMRTYRTSRAIAKIPLNTYYEKVPSPAH